MAIPHVIQKYLIEKRLKGKFGKARIKELYQILLELPGYKTRAVRAKKMDCRENRKSKDKQQDPMQR